MPLISNIYIILLLPLLAAFSCAIIKNKSLSHLVVVAFIIIILAQLFNLSELFLSGKYVYLNISPQIPSLFLNYNFNIVSLVFATLILFLKLASLIFFKEQIHAKIRQSNKTFYSAILLNIFAILAIVVSTNFINLFLAIEIYSISLLTCKSSIANKEQKESILNNISIHNLSFVIFAICILFLFVSFGSLEFSVIKEIIATKKINQYSVVLILFLLLSAISLRFFQFWVCFQHAKSKSSIQQYFLFQDLFVKSLIGVYLLLKLSNIFYVNANFLAEMNVNDYFTIIMSAFIIYICVGTLKQKNLKLLSIYYVIHHINLIILALLINNQHSLQSIFYYISSLCLSVFTLYLIAIIIENYIFSGIVNLKSDKQKGALIIVKIITISLLILVISPISIVFLGNFYLLSAALSHSLNFILIPTIFLVSISFFISALNARSDLSKKIMKEKIIKKNLNRSRINLSFFSYNFYLIIILSLILLNIIFLYFSGTINDASFISSQFINHWQL